MRGSSLEYLFSSALERESYSKLINQLIFSSIDVSDVMRNILGGTL